MWDVVLMAVKMSMLVLWVITPCGLVGRYQRFGATYREDGGSIFLWNVGIYLQVHTALQPRRTTSPSAKHTRKFQAVYVKSSCNSKFGTTNLIRLYLGRLQAHLDHTLQPAMCSQKLKSVPLRQRLVCSELPYTSNLILLFPTQHRNSAEPVLIRLYSKKHELHTAYQHFKVSELNTSHMTTWESYRNAV
jgi:hypothetical protein